MTFDRYRIDRQGGDSLWPLIEAGTDVMPWTANDMSRWPALVEAGVAGLITDHTGTLTGWSAA